MAATGQAGDPSPGHFNREKFSRNSATLCNFWAHGDWTHMCFYEAGRSVSRYCLKDIPACLSTCVASIQVLTEPVSHLLLFQESTALIKS